MTASDSRGHERRPIIGITVHLAEVVAPQGHREGRFELNARYAKVVRAAGGVPLLVPTHPDAAAQPADLLAGIDGLLLSGGGSLPASYFEDNPEPSLRQTNPPRYDVEVALVRAAAEAGMPLMGICRGMQTIAEALGGELKRDLRLTPELGDHYQESQPEVTTHSLLIESGSRLMRALGVSVRVNSFHRQAVTVPPPGWFVAAWSDDGLVEAIEAKEGFGLGCQFHPEWLGESEPGFDRLFQEFVADADSYKKKRTAFSPY